MVAAVACLLTALWASASLAAYEPTYARCTANNLRIRNKPSSTADILTHRLMDQDLVWVIGEQTSSGVTYLQIEYVDNTQNRRSGWAAYKTGSDVYFHLLSETEKQNLPYKNGELPSATGTTSAGSATSSSSSSSSSSGSSVSYRYLKVGSKGDDVKRLQQKLKDLKFYSGDVSGSFGVRTEDAVKAYQRKMGLYVDGIAGPTTQAKLFGTGGSSSSSGSSGASSTKYSDLGRTSADKVNLRTGPSTSNSSRASLARHTVVTILSSSRKGNETWYHVSVNGVRGYIRSDMLRILTVAEAEAYQSGTAPDPGSSSSTLPPSTVYRNLKVGSSGADVRALQQKLTELGYYSRSISGTYDARTQEAVRQFQKDNGLSADGIAGPLTQAKLYGTPSSSGGSGSSTDPTDPPAAVTYRTLRVGSSGEDVKALQQKLKDLGYYSGSVTGNFGTVTQDAVKRFQKAYNLYVDGIAGPVTQAKLYGTSSGGGSTANPKINGVENIHWNVFKAQMTGRFKPKDKAILTDVRTGRSFTLVQQSMGNHLDAEPATASDTAVLVSIYNGRIDYTRRAVWLTIGDRTFAGSIYAVPHGSSTVSGNNYNGQFCVHLLGSKTHVGEAEDKDHQRCVQEAYDAAKNKIP